MLLRNLAVILSIPLILTACNATAREGAGSTDSGQHGGSSSSQYSRPVHLADLEDESVQESSGIAASRRNAGLFWTHNDSGDGPFVYAFDRKGKRAGVWQVAGARSVDWEDIAVGPGPTRGRSYIYVGDIGNNTRNRDEVVVYRVPEPVITAQDRTSTKTNPRKTDVAEAIRLKYPDGKNDAEALLVHPRTGDIYIVTKALVGSAVVYKAAAPVSSSKPITLTRLGAAQTPGFTGGMITAGDISPDGRRVILCGYFGAYEILLPDSAQGQFDAIWKQTAAEIDLGSRRQGEAICYSLDGKAILTTSEGRPCPLFELTRK